MNYTPEKPFQITPDATLVYNLKHSGWRKGQETFENDVWISINSRHLPVEVREQIACIIRDALNRGFPHAQTDDTQ